MNEKKITSRYTKKQQANLDRENYKQWKLSNLETSGYFIIFSGFLSNLILKRISGNSLKLYLYMGINSNNMTGETFHSVEAIAKYFGKTERTIFSWMNELVELHLVRRVQFEYNGPAHTFLQPYSTTNRRKKEGTDNGADEGKTID